MLESEVPEQHDHHGDGVDRQIRDRGRPSLHTRGVHARRGGRLCRLLLLGHPEGEAYQSADVDTRFTTRGEAESVRRTCGAKNSPVALASAITRSTSE